MTLLYYFFIDLGVTLLLPCYFQRITSLLLINVFSHNVNENSDKYEVKSCIDLCVKLMFWVRCEAGAGLIGDCGFRLSCLFSSDVTSDYLHDVEVRVLKMQ